MTCRDEAAGGLVYRYCPDALPREADRLRGVMRARAVDEITGEPLRQELIVTTPHANLVPRAAGDGLVGLIGQPGRLFPDLAVSPVTLSMRVRSAGYLPLDTEGSIGPTVGFPDVFTPADLGDLPMHRIGVALAGRVVQRATVSPPPVSAAAIAIDGLWSTLPPANWMPPALMEAPNIVALEPGLYAPRPATSVIRQRNLTVQPLLAKRLIISASPGERRIRLSDRDGLGVGTVLVIDTAVAALREAIPIAQVDTSGDVDEFAFVDLEHPLAHLHRDGATCMPAATAAPIAADQLARDGIPGDRVAITNAAPGFAAGSTVEITTLGGAPREFQQVALFDTASDVDGFFRLPTIARVALVRLNVQHAGLTTARPIVTLDYRAAVQPVTVSME